MNFKRTSKFQRTNPEDYRTKLNISIDERGNKVRPVRDTWWLVESESSSKKTYLLQIHMKLLAYNGGRNAKNAYGRIECDCPSFAYCKITPRHCKHSVELARRFFGNASTQYVRLDKDWKGAIEKPDKWCGENYKIVEAMNGTSKKKKKYHTHAEKVLAHNHMEVYPRASREGMEFHPTNK